MIPDDQISILDAIIETEGKDAIEFIDKVCTIFLIEWEDNFTIGGRLKRVVRELLSEL